MTATPISISGRGWEEATTVVVFCTHHETSHFITVMSDRTAGTPRPRTGQPEVASMVVSMNSFSVADETGTGYLLFFLSAFVCNFEFGGKGGIGEWTKPS